MTREELKEHCEKQIEMCEMWAIAKGEEPSGNVYEEHKLILELLEQQPSCDDCISRADVDQTVEDNILCYTHSDRPIDQDPDTDCHKAIRIALKMLRKDLRKLPPVQPKIKTGHWIHRSTDDYGGITTWCECSECGRAVEDIYHVYGEYPYCHCGAKMIEPQAESEVKDDNCAGNDQNA